MSKPTKDFAWAIDPIAPEAFFRDYFEKRHLVVHRKDPAYYADLLSIMDIDHVVTDRVLSAGDLQLVNNGTGVEGEEFISAEGLIDPVKVAQQFAKGSTIILPALQHRLPKLAAYCRQMETVFCCDLQTNIYFTPDNAQGFKTHYDSHDVVVLQAYGTKTWNIYESPIELPLRSQAFDPKDFTPGKLIDTFVLGPGDMAYIPRGVVHDAIATDELSLHITTGLLSRRWVDLMLEAVAEQALTDPAFRKALPPGYASPEFDRTDAVATFADLMARVAERADPNRSLDTFAGEFRSKRLPVVPRQLVQHLSADALTAESVAGCRPGTFARVLPEAVPKDDEGGVTLEIYGTEVAFPGHVREALIHAINTESYRISDLPGDLDDAGKVVLVRRLVREGAVAILA